MYQRAVKKIKEEVYIVAPGSPAALNHRLFGLDRVKSGLKTPIRAFNPPFYPVWRQGASRGGVKK